MFYNDWLTKRNIYTPQREAVADIETGIRYTYREMNLRASNLASVLQKKYKIEPGDRVAAVSKNCIEYVDLFYACGKIGAILVPLNYRLPKNGLLELIEDCEPKLLAADSEFEDSAKSAIKKGFTDTFISFSGGDESIRQYVSESGFDLNVHTADVEEIAMILYTSGTTGKSKGAMISWRQIHWNTVNTTIGLSLTQKDVSIVNTPFYHTGGWHVLLAPLFHHGGKIILQPEFDPAESNHLIEKEGVTILFGIPTMLRMMMEEDNFDGCDFSSIRFAICGGESCPIPVIERYRDRDVPIRQGYGLTEAGPNCYSLPGEDAIRKKGSVGFPNFHIGVKIVDDQDTEVKQGEVGELLMKGPHAFSGYWKNEEATKKTLQDGWVRTGDLFKCDDEGYYYIVGRKKEMYISGGENVYPAQVEKVLYKHDAVSQAAVVGVPDKQWGEAGSAFIVLKEGKEITEEELKSYCRKHLAGFQCPKYFRFMDELPLGHSNKIQKRDLIKLFNESGE